MKQANNNEVDLLLRSLVRGRDEPALRKLLRSGDRNAVASEHLDADELNSYAEGVLPAPARVRYTEHLADCDTCRSMVIGLTQAAGATTSYELPDHERGLGFWHKLRALLSPAVLRYAVPALVMTAVIGIGLMTLWQPPRHDLVATNQPASSSTSTEQLKPTESPTNGVITETLPMRPKGSQSPAVNESRNEKSFLQDDKTRVAPGSGIGTGQVATSLPATKDAGQAGQRAGLSELRPSYAPEPKAAAPSSTPASLSEADKPTLLAKEQPAKREEQERQRDELSRNQASDEHGPNRSAAPRTAATPPANRRLDEFSVTRGGPNGPEKKAKAPEGESRTVSGRRFAREGNSWVDTAYDSSRTPIKVRRGSEQFRALVADEPGLRAIAEQLDGVVIVVWKNRAYRIQ